MDQRLWPEKPVIALEPFTNAEASEYIASWIMSEQQRFDDKVAAGATLVLSSKRRVHTLTCPSIQQSIRLKYRWPFNEEMKIDDLRHAVVQNGFPRLPKLMTPTEVNTSKRYTRCMTCSPNVTAKPTVYRTPTRAKNIGRRHIGRYIHGIRVVSVLITEDFARVYLADGTDRQYSKGDTAYFDSRAVSP